MTTEWRVSFTGWWRTEFPHRTEVIKKSEEDAREHFKGLKSMEAPHELRPCGKHIYDPKIEHREVVQEKWSTA
jgi:hypothetical protein